MLVVICWAFLWFISTKEPKHFVSFKFFTICFSLTHQLVNKYNIGNDYFFFEINKILFNFISIFVFPTDFSPDDVFFLACNTNIWIVAGIVLSFILILISLI